MRENAFLFFLVLGCIHAYIKRPAEGGGGAFCHKGKTKYFYENRSMTDLKGIERI